MSANGENRAWFEEIDLDPESPWLRMGTRQLGDRPWLVFDDRRSEELELKRLLCLTRHAEVFSVHRDAVEAGLETLALVSDQLVANGFPPPPSEAVSPNGQLHPLDVAGRSVQEDLCLLRREPAGWVLAGASLCFPSRWRLDTKMGRPLAAVHGPVEGYRTELSGRVDNLLDRLGNRIVWRRNWFIHPDADLFQPERPAGGDPTVPPERCLDELVVRSERQTLRRLPRSGWALFTIRIQQAPLGRFLGERQRLARFRRYLTDVAAADAAHRGLSADQVRSLRTAMRGAGS